jgi:ribonuclease P protein component
MKHTLSIRENYLFRRLYRIGKSSVTPYFAVYAKKNRLGYNRLGITATKKIGCAVERNRARRVITEAYRLLEDRLPKSFDYVIAARRKAVFVKMQVVRDSLAGIYGIAANDS